MYTDLFDAMGGGGGSSSGGGSSNNRGSGSGNDSDKPLASFKAGKMTLEKQNNGKYWVTPDTRRGQVNLKYNDDDQLIWEWYDRREKTVVDTIRVTSATKLIRAIIPNQTIAGTSSSGGASGGAEESKTTDAATAAAAAKDSSSNQPTSTATTTTQETPDQVYYWKLDNEWKMVWLQDKEVPIGLIDDVNDILKNPKKPQESSTTTDGTSNANNATTAATSGTSSTTSSTTGGNVGTAGGTTVVRSPGNASTASSSSTARQVDALSNILENLGMPQGETHNPTSSSSATSSNAGGGATGTGGTGGGGTTSTTSSTSGGTLTLADLQGVMAGLQQTQKAATTTTTTSQSSQTPPIGLQDIVTSDAITELLSHDDVRNRLLQELPEGQRTIEHLETNLRSPQVQSTLRTLTSALLPDDNGSLDGYHSVIANFQLNSNDGQHALTTTNNPIQAFLDCIIASVEKKKKEGTDTNETKEEETKSKDNDDNKKDKDEEMKEG